MPAGLHRVLMTTVACVILTPGLVTLSSAQETCRHRFFCDSLVRVYYGYTPEQITSIYDYALDSHYTDSAGTRHLYRNIDGTPDLEWKMKINGDIIYGNEIGLRFRLCAEPGESWVYRQLSSEILLMTYEGLTSYPVFGEPKPCRSFLEASVNDFDGDSVLDTIPTYRYILYDSVGAISRISVDHGSSFTIQGALCAHGFYGSQAVTVRESMHRLHTLEMIDDAIIVPIESWGSGTIHVFSYDGSHRLTYLVEDANVNIPNGSSTTRYELLFWVYESVNGLIYRGSVFRH